jgi:hypothetical protein
MLAPTFTLFDSKTDLSGTPLQTGHLMGISLGLSARVPVEKLVVPPLLLLPLPTVEVVEVMGEVEVMGVLGVVEVIS